MRALARHLDVAMRLHARNWIAVLYNYLFPLVYVASFGAIYRYESPLLLRHAGEFLALCILGGACFGLPTALVGERERGVWRQFRLTPVSTTSLVASTLISRYLTVLGAGIVQLLLAAVVGGWWPAHVFQLWIAFSFTAFALLGLGLVVAILADNVPAVQALGQCIFLPMLVIGGIAVKLGQLPHWARLASAFLPGRYAVEAMQQCVNGAGLAAARFDLAALFLIGASGTLIGIWLFRWDARQRFFSTANKSWIGVALVSWALIGVVAVRRENEATRLRLAARPAPPVVATVQPAPAPVANPAAKAGPEPLAPKSDEPWRKISAFNYAALPIADMPSDDGNISPIAAEGEAAAGSSLVQLKQVAETLPNWAPGHVADPVQRVRNYLYILGAADYSQSTIERFLPAVVLDRMQAEFPSEELPQLLCWVALHPDEGSQSALSDPLLLDLGAANLDPVEVRNRVYFYAVKLTRWTIGW